jgi:hypothetical protein
LLKISRFVKICPDSIRFPTPKISQNTVSAQIAKKATCGYSGIRIQILVVGCCSFVKNGLLVEL